MGSSSRTKLREVEGEVGRKRRRGARAPSRVPCVVSKHRPQVIKVLVAISGSMLTKIVVNGAKRGAGYAVDKVEGSPASLSRRWSKQRVGLVKIRSS